MCCCCDLVLYRRLNRCYGVIDVMELGEDCMCRSSEEVRHKMYENYFAHMLCNWEPGLHDNVNTWLALNITSIMASGHWITKDLTYTVPSTTYTTFLYLWAGINLPAMTIIFLTRVDIVPADRIRSRNPYYPIWRPQTLSQWGSLWNVVCHKY